MNSEHQQRRPYQPNEYEELELLVKLKYGGYPSYKNGHGYIQYMRGLPRDFLEEFHYTRGGTGLIPGDLNGLCIDEYFKETLYNNLIGYERAKFNNK